MFWSLANLSIITVKRMISVLLLYNFYIKGLMLCVIMVTRILAVSEVSP